MKRARSKQLAPDEYNSGNFTISNLGMFGADTFDAILPPGKPFFSPLHQLNISILSPALVGKLLDLSILSASAHCKLDWKQGAVANQVDQIATMPIQPQVLLELILYFAVVQSM